MGQKGGFNQNCPFWGGESSARTEGTPSARLPRPRPAPERPVGQRSSVPKVDELEGLGDESEIRNQRQGKRAQRDGAPWSAPLPSLCCSKTEATGWNQRRHHPQGLKIRVLDKASAQMPLRHDTRSFTQIPCGSSHWRAELTLSKTLQPFLFGNCNVLEPNRGAPERLRIIFAATQTARNIQVHVHAGHLTRSLRDFGLVWAFLNVSGLYFYVTVQATDMAGYGTKIKTTR